MPRFSDWLGFAAKGTGAVPRTFRDKARDAVSLSDFLTTEQRADVESDAGLVDCLPALRAAIESVTRPGGFVYPVAGAIELPRGTIFLSGTLVLDAAVQLRGHAAGMSGGNWGTRLKFPADTPGVVVKKGAVNPTQNGGDASILSGVYLMGGGGESPSAHGIDVQSRLKLRDITVSGFAGNGVHIVADVADRKNANLWEMDTASISNNGGNGIYVQGGDANAGVATLVDCKNNGQWGINDASFLGNTWIACHADGNGRRSMVHHNGARYYCINSSLAGATTPGTDPSVWVSMGPGVAHPTYYPDWTLGGQYLEGGAYRSAGANARSTWIGCYSEQGTQPPSYFYGPTHTVIGGIHAAGITGNGTVLVDGRIGVISTEKTALGASAQFGRGAGNQEAAVLSLFDPHLSGAYPYRLQYETGQWRLNWGGLGAGDWLHLYNRDASAVNGWSRDMSALNGGIGFPNGFYMGSRALIRVAHGAAPPASGEWKRGDRVYNVSPSPGSYAGWICTTAGTPGTWKGFGLIET